MKKKIIFIVGPTAVGKTAVAVNLAKIIDAEIISCDSMQVYKGMDIITSKPNALLIKRIPHHLINMVCPSKDFDVARYRKASVSCIDTILKKAKVPLFVGGTGLYVSVLIDGIFTGSPEDALVRQRLYKEKEAYGSAKLYRRLQRVDPIAANKIHPNDIRRIVRALEVFEVSGRPISQLQAKRRGLSEKYDIRIFCLTMQREALYERINQRVEKMFTQGLVAEVKRLCTLKLSKTAQYAIGIREIMEYSDGRLSLEEAKELIKRNTRRYAKRQLTWFRKDKRIQWLEVGAQETPTHIAKRIETLSDSIGKLYPVHARKCTRQQAPDSK